MDKELYEMKLGGILHDFGTQHCMVMRIPGGWIFTFWGEGNRNPYSSVFVPYNNEFCPPIKPI